MKLAIRIRKGDDIAPGCLEAGSKRGAVPTVVPVPDQTNARMICDHSPHVLCSAVTAAVIDDDDLVFEIEMSQRLIGFSNGVCNAGFFVVSGDHEREHIGFSSRYAGGTYGNCARLRH